ncbi:hypothetical protein BCR33DRAFT_715110 [Rhizoclosmatium globosum]|uniref:T-cell immunomodulatory protein TIP C2 domain-containing protein n=1 Tax=Rhizoclosmatium globosum TaxID=329046 RepID=A0A1Y2CLZ9_9FUNG|nr:hypothetical protein BCR33DRAFT_715110 [Rhizoclosmatium globosum]|eukprot:ORY47385.1 hypothetical protein BCR33DRAFT_715110 [Rhizoclosmatium globosum]
MGSLSLATLPSLQPSFTLTAFGDLNSDKNTDLFVLSDKAQLSSLLFDPKTKDFTTAIPFIHGLSSVSNVLDVLVMGQTSDNSHDLGMAIVWGGAKDQKLVLPPASGTAGQPFVVDFNGTMETQLLGYPSSAPSDLSLWRIQSNRTVSVEKAPLIDKTTNKTMCTFSNPHSNAFIDLNGDCLADMFVTCSQGKRSFFQVWTNSRDAGFSLALEKDLPNDVHGPITFADMDADGTMDLVFGSCDARGACSVNIWYNSQIPLSFRQHLCTADNTFNFNLYNDQWSLKDLLGNTDETMDISSFIRLIHSTPCTKGLCPKDQVLEHERYFKLMTTGMEALNNMGGIKTGAAFFDLFEDGVLDILVFTQNDKKTPHITAFQNNFYSDGFFLKSLVLNGVCPGRCPSGARFPDPKPYGVNYFGATLKYTITDASGFKRATQLSQLPQSSYFALNTPYTLTDNVATFFGVIPNSQLIVVPYESDAGGPSEWKLDLFINPSSLAPWVFLALVSTLVGLTGIVIFLHFLERKEDQIEKRINSHNINFDAL